MTNVNVSFLLHLYQPPTQSEAVFKKIAGSCYIPLLKLLKNNTALRLTLNVPLSLLEQFDKYGYSEWLKDLKELNENERIEVTGSAAYHPLLTKVPEQIVTEEIILNEYGLGYYLGSKQGFEGENSIMLKNVKGFFPPELALNEEVLATINTLGYEWVIADKCAIPGMEAAPFVDNIYKYKDNTTLIVVRDCELSNLISFKRDSEVDALAETVLKRLTINNSLVIALDGEVFGHHNESGIYVLEALIDALRKNGVSITTVSDLLTKNIEERTSIIYESNWSEVVCSTEPAKIYTLWDNKENKIQQCLWEMQREIIAKYLGLSKAKDIEGFENVAVWKRKDLLGIAPEALKHIDLSLLVHKSIHSDQFWWASGEKIYDKVLFNPEMVSKALNIYKELAAMLGDEVLIKLVYAATTEIEQSLKDNVI